MTGQAPSGEEWEDLPKLLALLSSGSLSIRIDGDPLMSVDVDHKDIDVQIAPLLARQDAVMPAVARSGTDALTGLLTSVRMAGELAQEEWRISIKDGSREIAEVGRGTPSVSGHVRFHAGAFEVLREQFGQRVRRML